MLKIDIHTHILPEHLPRFAQKFGYGGFVHLEHHKPCCARMMIDNRFFREIESNCWDPEQRILECDTHKVHVQVLSTIPVMFNYWAKPSDTLAVAQFLNDHIAAIVHRYPHRFVGLGTIPMQDEKLAIQELERCMKLGLKGIQIGTNVNGLNLNEPQLFNIFEASEALGAAVFVHPWDMVGKERMQKYWLPWLVGMPAETALALSSMIFGGVFARLPKLRIAFAHGGGSFPATIGRIVHGFEARPDLCAIDNNVSPREYIGRFYLDSLVHDPLALDYLVKLVGAKHIALGSDYPFPLGEDQPGTLIEQMPFDNETKTWLLHKTAMEWLNCTYEELKINPILE